MSEKIINLPLTDEIVKDLHAGDRVLLNGIIYTGRDEAHLYLCRMLDAGEKLPIEIKGATIYYVGPCPAKPGQAIGSAGPTTSGRMDAYAPRLMDIGLKGMIGKGTRKPPVIESMKKNTCVYFAAIGGAGALLSKCIKSAEIKAYEDLGAEALRLITVEDFPVVVAIDSLGNDIYGEKQA